MSTLSFVFSAHSTCIDPSRTPDQYPLSDMVCNRACMNKGGGGKPQEPKPLTPPCCYVQPCLVSSNQSALIKPVSCTQVMLCVCVAQAWPTCFRGQCCHPRTCVYPDITNSSQSLYRHILLQWPHTCVYPHTHTEAIKNIKSMESDKQLHVLL